MWLKILMIESFEFVTRKPFSEIRAKVPLLGDQTALVLLAAFQSKTHNCVSAFEQSTRNSKSLWISERPLSHHFHVLFLIFLVFALL